MIKLSIVIITLNEEKNLGRCLESVKNLGDEILVVDSFSTDQTEEIASKFGARFVQQKFLGHIEQKNYAASIAQNNWVLSLDADEALSSELRKSIENVLVNPQKNAYAMNRLTNYCGKWIHHCGWYPDTKLRLWNRTKGTWGGTNPHDFWELHSKTDKPGKLKGDLHHYSYYTISDHIKQIEKFTEIAAHAAVAKGKSCSLFKIYFGPIYKFLHSYFIRLGFLDGYSGYLICKLSAMSSFVKYTKIRQYAKQKN